MPTRAAGLLARRGARAFHAARRARHIEDNADVQELMDLGAVPADNRTEPRAYTLPRALLASWRQQRRFAGSSVEGKFRDVAVVKVRSGDGGNGKISFLREAGRSVGPPDGGDGGAGGSVYVQASPQVSTLAHIRHIYAAQAGRGGGSTQLTGKRGENVVLHVPVGTQLRWAPALPELRALMGAADELSASNEEVSYDNATSADEALKAASVDEGVNAEAAAEAAAEATAGTTADAAANAESTESACSPAESARTDDPPSGVVTVDVVTNYTRFDADVGIQLQRDVFADGTGGWLFREQEEERWLANADFRRIAQRVKHYDLIHRRAERASDMFPFGGIDLDRPGEPVLLVRGGAGGLGNMHFQTPQLRGPTFAKRGRPGCELTLIMELKMLADLGLVGLPNAGKSTLLRAISRARPRVGDYEFTTLTPSVGTISLGIDGTSFSVADIPGIIKDAHLDKGLGLGFLRHIERCQGLAFVIDLSRADPVADLELLMAELGDRARNKNILVVATKADCEGTRARYDALSDHARAAGWDIVPCSAQEGSVEGVIAKMAVAANVGAARAR